MNPKQQSCSTTIGSFRDGVEKKDGGSVACFEETLVIECNRCIASFKFHLLISANRLMPS
jgi:hypothetical protein